MTTQTAIAIGLIAYVIVTTAVSFFWMTRVKKPADYLVAGRGLPVWALLGTIVGTCIGTGVIIGGSGLAYQHGWAGSAYPIGLGLGTLIAGLSFAKMRRYKFMTMSEEIACYYQGNRGVVEFSNITLFLSQLCWLTVQIKGGAAVLGAVTGLDPKLCIVLAGLAKAAISIPGGLKAVVYTDVLQTLILFGGFGFLIHAALKGAGGLDGLRESVPPNYSSFLGVASYGLWNVIGLILVTISNPIADPARRLTMYSASSEKTAKLSMVASGIVVILFAATIGIAGMYAFKLNPTLKQRDEALPWLVTHVLPPWSAAMVVVAIVAGISSAANACAAAAGTFFVRHIWPLATGRFPSNPVRLVRWALGFAFLISTIMAVYTGNIVDFVKIFLPLTMSGLGVVVLVGRFWKRANWQGALAALIATPLTQLTVIFTPTLKKFWGDASIIPALLVGFFAQVIVTLLTPVQTRGFDEIAAEMNRERDSIEGVVPSGLADNPLTKPDVPAKPI